MVELIFWISLVVLIYIYFGYPALVWIVSKIFYKPVNKRYITPRISFILVAHNEEKFIEEKIKNILELDYPQEKLEIIIGSDGSTDNTNEILESFNDESIKAYISQEHVGKPNMLNRVVSQASGQILVFSDARQRLEINALKELVANFADPSVGCASGELIFNGEGQNGVAKGVGAYWRYEKFMRKKESQINSMIGATGAIYAIRKCLYVKPPQDTILDDVFIPLRVVEQGFRAIFDSQTLAYDRVASKSGEEFTRKVRTLAGNFQLFVQFKRLFNPLKSKIAWQFFSHKLLRAIAFLFLVTLFIANLLLKNIYPYNFIFILQIIFYGAAFLGLIFEKLRIKGRLLSIPYVFCVLNLAALKGFLRFMLGKQKVTWEKAH